MASKNIVVVGSANTDMVIQADNLPQSGETVLGDNFFMNPGGKGANQAVTAARLGADITFISKVGKDQFGEKMINNLKNENINTSYVSMTSEAMSGVAVITIDKKAENTIVVAPGANNLLSSTDLNKAEKSIKQADIVVAQLEIPQETVIYLKKLAVGHNIPFLLNPAPACKLSDDLLNGLTIITPNQIEAESLTGVKVRDLKSAKLAASFIRGKGVKNVIITMGEKGAYLMSDQFNEMIPTPKVKAVDTTAAGDVFNGALAVALSDDYNIKQASIFACESAGLSTTKLGAQSSIPYQNEIGSDWKENYTTFTN